MSSFFLLFYFDSDNSLRIIINSRYPTASFTAMETTELAFCFHDIGPDSFGSPRQRHWDVSHWKSCSKVCRRKS